MIRFLLIFISIFLFAKDTNLTLQLNWKYQFEFAGFIMAKEKGFYKDVGLNVNLKEWDGKTNIIDYVLNNKNSIGISTASLFKEITHQKPIEIIMPTFQSSPLVLGVVGYKDIYSLQDLIKHNIPISNMIKDVMPIMAMLKVEKIDINKLNFVDFKINDFKNKKGAYLFYLSNEPYTLNKKHIPYHIFDPKDYGFASYGNILFTSQNFSKENPQTLEKFITATKKGFNYAFNHINETIATILHKYNTQDETFEELKFEAQTLKPIIGFNFDFYKMDNLKNLYILSGVMDVNLKQYIFTQKPLSPISKNFIQSHIIKCISTITWPPFNFQSKGQMKGIAIDYWKLITKKLNLKYKCIIAPDFTTALNAIKNKKADVLLATGKTADREKYALFSKPYASFPFVIATRNNIGFIEDLNIIKNKTIAVGKNYTAENILKQHYPNIKLLLVKNTKEALKAVEQGKAFGAVDVLPVIAYNINNYQFSTLKISGKLPYNFDIRFMVRKDLPQLVQILNKAIDSLSIEDKTKISQKWVPVVYEKGFSFEDLKEYFIASILVVIILILWIVSRIKIEKELKKAKEKAQQAEKAKSEFLANMSHEIRTPLNAMFGFIQLLQDKKLDNESQKYLNIIEKSGKNLLTIINDILDFSKLEAGKLNIEKVEFNPKEEIEIIFNLFKSEAKQKNINLIKKEENLNYNIISDPTRIKQVIANLLSNAIKFTPNGKKIELIVKYDDKNEKLYVEVIDEGIGIPKEKQKTIFDAFSQADNSTTRKYGGTGLGLSISYKLIKLLGGELKVESELEKGSKFYFEIPAKKSSPITSTKKETKKSTNKKYNYHILLVEDNKANQMFMKVLFQKLGITFDIANDGIEAIEKFKKNKYDIIFMDENMPNMNGITATKEIRKIEKENNLDHTIIIALTANALEGDKDRFILAGMDYYLSKPLDIEKLKQILDKLEK